DSAANPVWWSSVGQLRARFGHTYRLRLQVPGWAPRLRQEPPRVMIQMPGEGIILPGLLLLPALIFSVVGGLCVIAIGLVTQQSMQ
ncbi:MAG TPA: hypothetical protein VHW25_06080, partial [Steroidobacteraceae bacterium]|nr:hypothetical protein [Steroidobacteraceae bacterium]